MCRASVISPVPPDKLHLVERCFRLDPSPDPAPRTNIAMQPNSDQYVINSILMVARLSGFGLCSYMKGQIYHRLRWVRCRVDSGGRRHDNSTKIEHHKCTDPPRLLTL